MATEPITLTTLTAKQAKILDTWYSVEQEHLHTLLYSIAKYSALPHLDTQLTIQPEESRSLIALADMLQALELSR